MEADLPDLPERWREESLQLILGFLREQDLQGSVHALEGESGIKLSSYGAEITFLHRLVVHGEWEECLAFLAPLAGHVAVDHGAATCAVHVQRFLELLEAQDRRPSVPELVEALQHLELIAPPEEFGELCYIMTLPRLQDHPQHRDWTAARGRQRCFARLYSLLEGVYPPAVLRPQVAPSRLVTLLRQALGYQQLQQQQQQRHAVRGSSPQRGGGGASLLVDLGGGGGGGAAAGEGERRELLRPHDPSAYPLHRHVAGGGLTGGGRPATASRVQTPPQGGAVGGGFGVGAAAMAGAADLGASLSAGGGDAAGGAGALAQLRLRGLRALAEANLAAHASPHLGPPAPLTFTDRTHGLGSSPAPSPSAALGTPTGRPYGASPAASPSPAPAAAPSSTTGQWPPPPPPPPPQQPAAQEQGPAGHGAAYGSPAQSPAARSPGYETVTWSAEGSASSVQHAAAVPVTGLPGVGGGFPGQSASWEEEERRRRMVRASADSFPVRGVPASEAAVGVPAAASGVPVVTGMPASPPPASPPGSRPLPPPPLQHGALRSSGDVPPDPSVFGVVQGGGAGGAGVPASPGAYYPAPNPPSSASLAASPVAAPAQHEFGAGPPPSTASPAAVAASSNQGSLRGSSSSLSAPAHPAPSPPPLEAYGRLRAREGFRPSVLLEDAQAVRAVAYDPRGRYLAVGANSRLLRVYELPHPGGGARGARASQSPVLRLERAGHHQGSVYCVAWDGASRAVASGSNDQTVRVVPLLDGGGGGGGAGGATAVLKGHTGTVRAVAYCGPSGAHLVSAGAGDCAVRVWDVEKGAAVSHWAGHTGAVAAIAATPQSSTVMTAGADGIVRVWDLRVATQVQDIPVAGAGGISALAATDRSLAIGLASGECRVLEAGSGRPLFEMAHHTDEVRCVDFAPGGSWLLTASFDGTLAVADPRTGALAGAAMRSHADKIILARWDPAAPGIASCSADRTVRLWDPLGHP